MAPRNIYIDMQGKVLSFVMCDGQQTQVEFWVTTKRGVTSDVA